MAGSIKGGWKRCQFEGEITNILRALIKEKKKKQDTKEETKIKGQDQINKGCCKKETRKKNERMKPRNRNECCIKTYNKAKTQNKILCYSLMGHLPFKTNSSMQLYLMTIF